VRTSSDAAAASRRVLEEVEGVTEDDMRFVTAFVSERLASLGKSARVSFKRTPEALKAAVEARADAIAGLGAPGSPLRAVAEAVAEEMRSGLAQALKDLPRDPKRVWAKYEDPLHFPAALVTVAGDYLEDCRLRRLPATPAAVSEGLLNVAARGLEQGERDSRDRVAIMHGSLPVAEVNLQLGIERVARSAAEVAVAWKELPENLKALGNAYALPLMEYLVELSQTGAQGLVVIPGVKVEKEGANITLDSWRCLAAGVLGRAPSDRLTAIIRTLAHVLSSMSIRWPDGMTSSAPWILLDDDERRVGRPENGPTFTIDSRLQLGEAGRARAFARRSGKLGGREREGLRLVPLVRPRVIEGESSSQPNTLASQFSYIRHLWRHFVRAGLAEGGARVTDKDRADLADAAQLPRHVEERMPEHLEASGVIVRTDDERWAPADEATRRFIIDGAEQRAEKSRRYRAKRDL